MTFRSTPEIMDKIEALWPEADKRAVKRNDQGEVRVSISSMYEAPGLTFAQLMALAEWFDTKDIADERFHSGGCETCDYGSDYGFELIIKPMTGDV